MSGVRMAMSSGTVKPLTATQSPASASGSGHGSTHAWSLTCTVTGGSGSYSYSWASDEFGDPGTAWSFGSQGSATTLLTVTGVGYGGGVGSTYITCTVVDLVTGKSAQTPSGVFQWFNTTGIS